MLDWKVAWWWWRWWWWCFVLMTSAWDVSEKFFSGWMYDSTLLIEGSINSIRLYFIKLTKDFVLEDDISSDISAARTRVPLFAMKFRSKFRYGRKTKKRFCSIAAAAAASRHKAGKWSKLNNSWSNSFVITKLSIYSLTIWISSKGCCCCSCSIVTAAAAPFWINSKCQTTFLYQVGDNRWTTQFSAFISLLSKKSPAAAAAVLQLQSSNSQIVRGPIYAQTT